MALTEWKEEALKRMPIIETAVKLSEDGKTVIHRTTITDLKPVEYYKAVMDGFDTCGEHDE